MNFQEAEKYLLSLGNEVDTMKLGLENIRRLLAALGDPQREYLKVQVAGTNGKGSVCAFLDSICNAAHLRVGIYTSPHLESITERVRIAGVDISKEKFARLATRIRDRSESLMASGKLDKVPTFFEQVTAIALVAFAEAKVELAILETGLGGRLDATTAANAEIAAITRIDLDHQQYLGETIEEVAAEKAAIIHAGSRVVVGEQEPEVMEVILGRCRSVSVTPTLATAGGNPTGREGDPILDFGSWILDLRTPSTSDSGYGPVRLGLLGSHQVENAKIAVVLAEMLRERFEITNEQIISGLENARHPGRLEFSGRFLFDGAHNVGGAKALRSFLDEHVHQPIIMIFGAMNDKPLDEIGAVLFPKADNLILTRADNLRALPAIDLLKVVSDKSNVFTIDNVGQAVAKALEISATGDLIVVTGSLYLVGEVRGILAELSGITDN